MDYRHLLHQMYFKVLTLVFITTVDTMPWEDTGDCVYNFDVWRPPDDVMQRMRILETTCSNVSLSWQKDLAELRAHMYQDQLSMHNATHRLERALLEQRLADVQLEIKMKDMNLELVGMRSDVTDMKASHVTGGGHMTGSGRGKDRPARLTAGVAEVQNALGDIQTTLSTVKNGVGDLRAEWLLIKRQVTGLETSVAASTRNQQQLQDDVVNLKEDLDDLQLDMRRQTSLVEDGNQRMDKIEKGLTSTDDDEAFSRQLTDLTFQHGELQNALEQIRAENGELKREVLGIAVASGNMTNHEALAEWLRKQPKAHHRRPWRDENGDYPKDCHEVYDRGYDTSGVYQIKPRGAAQLDNIYCEMLNGSGWTVVQRRLDGTLSFSRRWLEYKFGFGQMYGEFWLGMDRLHHLTSQRQSRLRIDFWDWEGTRTYAEYDYVKVDSEVDKYRLHVRGYSGDAGDSLSYHDDMAFSTEDSDNDMHMRNCAADNKGGWWYNSCYTSNLNGVHHTGWYSHGKAEAFSDGIVWFTLKESEFYSLKHVEIKVQPAYI